MGGRRACWYRASAQALKLISESGRYNRAQRTKEAVTLIFRQLAQPLLAAAGALALAPVLGLSPAAGSTSPPPGVLAPIHGTYAPRIDPAGFVRGIDNPYLPYAPGTRIHFVGVRGRIAQRDDEVVRHATKRILGV